MYSYNLVPYPILGLGRHATTRVHYLDRPNSRSLISRRACATGGDVTPGVISRSAFPVRMVEAELFLRYGISNIVLIWRPTLGAWRWQPKSSWTTTAIPGISSMRRTRRPSWRPSAASRHLRVLASRQQPVPLLESRP